MNNGRYFLKVYKTIEDVINELYPNKYTLSISDSNQCGLKLHSDRVDWIVSPISITDEGYVCFFNCYNDLMDEFNEIETEVNNRLKDFRQSSALATKNGILTHWEQKELLEEDQYNSQNNQHCRLTTIKVFEELLQGTLEVKEYVEHNNRIIIELGEPNN